MAVKISPVLNGQQFSDAGVLLVGGKIETYLAGSSTPAITYTNSLGNVAQPNPIVLNSRGEVANPIYLTTGITYKLILKDVLNNTLRTMDNIEGVNDSLAGFDQWVNSLVTPVFINATQFSVAGDQTNAFLVNRRVKLLVTSGIVHGYITASVFTSLTTVTVILDSGILDSGLSSVQLGLITPINSSLRVLQSMIASNVAATGPVFSAQSAVNQTIATATNTKVTLGTETRDTNANFDPALSRHTPTIAGDYSYIGGVLWNSPAARSLAITYFAKNGSLVASTRGTAELTYNTSVNLSFIFNMNGTTDYVELFANQQSGANLAAIAGAETFLSGVLVRAA